MTWSRVRTRKSTRWLRGPDVGFAYVLDNVLAQGSRPPIGGPLAPRFTTLVLCAQELLEETPQGLPGAFPDVVVLKVPLDDAKPSLDEVRRALVAGHNVAMRIRCGERVLSTCNQGRNRSGLVTGFTLMELGMSANEAIARVKHARKNALTNPYFVQVLRAYDKVPRLPSHSMMV